MNSKETVNEIDSQNQGYLYVIHVREFLRNGEHIFKVGRTENIKRRMSQYPKGSKLIASIIVSHAHKFESQRIGYIVCFFFFRFILVPFYWSVTVHILNAIVDRSDETVSEPGLGTPCPQTRIVNSNCKQEGICFKNNRRQHAFGCVARTLVLLLDILIATAFCCTSHSSRISFTLL
jgi:hypothetical protein